MVHRVVLRSDGVSASDSGRATSVLVEGLDENILVFFQAGGLALELDI